MIAYAIKYKNTRFDLYVSHNERIMYGLGNAKTFNIKEEAEMEKSKIYYKDDYEVVKVKIEEITE